MAGGFTRQIRGLGGGGGSSSSSNANTTSDNYSYYVRSEEQESYKRKNSAWDPGRSFADQHKGTIKNENHGALMSNPIEHFKKDALASEMPGVKIYPSDQYNSNAGITSMDPTTGDNQLSKFEEDLLIKRGLKTIHHDNSLFSRYSGTITKIGLLIVLCIAGTMLINGPSGSKKDEPKYYYEEDDF